ncbi:hypothetical protein C8J57DRAFT_1464973 [Mycena rebaudengoi]|nr:hypothetical protein C8J57DRAFT_1464973 [Mycena rebaudengoi]
MRAGVLSDTNNTFHRMVHSSQHMRKVRKSHEAAEEVMRLRDQIEEEKEARDEGKEFRASVIVSASSSVKTGPARAACPPAVQTDIAAASALNSDPHTENTLPNSAQAKATGILTFSDYNYDDMSANVLEFQTTAVPDFANYQFNQRFDSDTFGLDLSMFEASGAFAPLPDLSLRADPNSDEISLPSSLPSDWLAEIPSALKGTNLMCCRHVLLFPLHKKPLLLLVPQKHQRRRGRKEVDTKNIITSSRSRNPSKRALDSAESEHPFKKAKAKTSKRLNEGGVSGPKCVVTAGTVQKQSSRGRIGILMKSATARFERRKQHTQTDGVTRNIIRVPWEAEEVGSLGRSHRGGLGNGLPGTSLGSEAKRYAVASNKCLRIPVPSKRRDLGEE